MDRTVKLTSEEIANITCALQDKVMNLTQAVIILGEELTPNTLQRIETLRALALKLNGIEC